MEMFNPPHPGIILLEDWIKPLGLSITEFALKIDTSRKNLSEIVNSKCGISPEMALKLSKALGTSAELWLNLQQAYDLWQAKQRVNLDEIEVIWMCFWYVNYTKDYPQCLLANDVVTCVEIARKGNGR